MASREQVASRTQVDLPGDRLLEQGIEWSKQNLADSVQEARRPAGPLHRRGQAVPAAGGHGRRTRAASAPASPTTRGCSRRTASTPRSPPSRRASSRPIEDHLRALRDVSVHRQRRPRARSSHEVVTDGSVYFGADSSTPGNTDETAKFPSARRAGRGAGPATTPSATSCIRSRCATCTTSSSSWTPTATAGPRGSATSSATGMGEEKLDITDGHDPRAVRPRRPRATRRATRHARVGARPGAQARDARFEAAWWMAGVPGSTPTRSTTPATCRSYQRHWIGVTPMEIELAKDGPREPGPRDAATTGTRPSTCARRPCFSTDFGALPHRACPGCDGGPAGTGERSIFTLNTADHGGRRGQLRPARPGPAAALHRPRTGACSCPIRTSSRARCRRSRRRPTYGPLDRPAASTTGAMVAAGVGHVRHAVARGAPAARRAAGHGPARGSRSCRRCRAASRASAGSNIRLGRRRRGRDAPRTREAPTRPRVALGVPLSRLHDRPHAAARRRRWRGRRSTAARWPTPRSRANRGVEVLVNAPTSGTHELVVTSR